MGGHVQEMLLSSGWVPGNWVLLETAKIDAFFKDEGAGNFISLAGRIM